MLSFRSGNTLLISSVTDLDSRLLSSAVISNSTFVSYISRKLGQACRPITPVKQGFILP